MKLNRGCPIVASWIRELARRTCTLWYLKMPGTIVGISAFLAAYFWIMSNPLGQPATMPVTSIDRWIGVSEIALLPYASLWVYVSLAPAFARGVAELENYLRGAAMIAIVGLVVFWFFPTTVPVFPIDWTQYPGLHFLKSTDTGGNAFPSLHVAFAGYTMIVIGRQLRSLCTPPWPRWVNRIWFIAIVYSTIATRQHVLVDVLGGLLLAWLAGWSTQDIPQPRILPHAVPRKMTSSR